MIHGFKTLPSLRYALPSILVFFLLLATGCFTPRDESSHHEAYLEPGVHPEVVYINLLKLLRNPDSLSHFSGRPDLAASRIVGSGHIWGYTEDEQVMMLELVDRALVETAGEPDVESSPVRKGLVNRISVLAPISSSERVQAKYKALDRSRW